MRLPQRDPRRARFSKQTLKASIEVLQKLEWEKLEIYQRAKGCTPRAPSACRALRAATATKPPRGRLRTKAPSQTLPKLPQGPSTYCPACMREYRAGKNDKPTRRSHRTDGLCVWHASASAAATRKRCASPSELTARKRWRLNSASSGPALHTSVPPVHRARVRAAGASRYAV